jgi:hypothetical protein
MDNNRRIIKNLVESEEKIPYRFWMRNDADEKPGHPASGFASHKDVMLSSDEEAERYAIELLKDWDWVSAINMKEADAAKGDETRKTPKNPDEPRFKMDLGWARKGDTELHTWFKGSKSRVHRDTVNFDHIEKSEND